MAEEIDSQYEMRVRVYERAVADGLDGEKADLMATIFKNCYFMGCTYHEDVMKQS